MKPTQIIACSAAALCIAAAGCAEHSAKHGSDSYASPAAGKTSGLRAQSGQTRQQVFDQLDTNRDGMISRAESEANPDLVAIFVTTDANDDGTLSVVEFELVPITFGTAVGGTSGVGSGTGGPTGR
jgi:hypothetical protein